MHTLVGLGSARHPFALHGIVAAAVACEFAVDVEQPGFDVLVTHRCDAAILLGHGVPVDSVHEGFAALAVPG